MKGEGTIYYGGNIWK